MDSLTEADFEVSCLDQPPSTFFFSDPIENLQFSVTVKRVPRQIRKIVIAKQVDSQDSKVGDEKIQQTSESNNGNAGISIKIVSLLF